jgi:anthranilate/para-aminobenzoate synthase component I
VHIVRRRVARRLRLDRVARSFDEHADLVWLDSGLPEGAPAEAAVRARWSMLCLTDGPFAAVFRHADGRAHVSSAPASSPWFDARDDDSEAFGVLSVVLQRTPRPLAGMIPGLGFALGWVGYLGYELGRVSGGPDRRVDGHPDGELRFVDRAIVVDHVRNESWIMALAADHAADASAANREWVDRTAAQLASDVGVDADVESAPPIRGERPAHGRVSRAVYVDAVEHCRDEIRHGNAFQVCLTTAFEIAVRTDATPLDEYVVLREGDRVPFGSFLRLGTVTIASRSPERFLSIADDGRVVAEPIKGTRPRLSDPVRDARMRTELFTSVKDRAENVMIVDLLRNDLLRNATPGTVRVERLCAIESYATVHQLVSTITARLPDGADRAKVVRDAFPPGSMTGAPKISAMAIADRLEGTARGAYSGVVGYFSTTGAVDLAVTIRALVTVQLRNGSTRRTIGAGGAVTWASEAQDEADEVETKARAVARGVGAILHW